MLGALLLNLPLGHGSGAYRKHRNAQRFSRLRSLADATDAARRAEFESWFQPIYATLAPTLAGLPGWPDVLQDAESIRRVLALHEEFQEDEEIAELLLLEG